PQWTAARRPAGRQRRSGEREPIGDGAWQGIPSDDPGETGRGPEKRRDRRIGEESPVPWWKVVGQAWRLLPLVLDRAAASGGFLRGRRLALERGLDGRLEVVDLRVGLLVVHGAHVDDLAVLVQDEEFRGDAGAERTADLLRFIVQVGEVEALF